MTDFLQQAIAETPYTGVKFTSTQIEVIHDALFLAHKKGREEAATGSHPPPELTQNLSLDSFASLYAATEPQSQSPEIRRISEHWFLWGFAAGSLKQQKKQGGGNVE